MSLSITVCYTWKFSRIATSGNTSAQLADNGVGSTGYRYSSTPLQYGKGILYSSYVPHDCTYAYKASIFSGFVASPPHVGGITFSFFLLSFSSPSMFTIDGNYLVSITTKIMAIYPYPFSGKIIQLFSLIIFINDFIFIFTGSPG